MADYTTINKPDDFFDCRSYTGTGSNNITLTMDDVGIVWIKNQGASADHILIDIARGGNNSSSQAPILKPNTNAGAQGTDVTATGGIAFGSTSTVIGSDNGGYNYNSSGANYMCWHWRTGGSASNNTDGTTTTSVSANTTSGVSVGTYVGTSANATIGHGLGGVAECLLIKNRDSGSRKWAVWFKDLSSATKYLSLSATSTEQNDSQTWINTVPTSTVFSSGGSGEVNQGSQKFVFYGFTSVRGFSKIGMYIGNGQTENAYINCGFRPSFVLYKNNSETDEWFFHDDQRDGFNDDNEYLRSPTNAGNSDGINRIRLLSNGFKITTSDKGAGKDGSVYMYMAFARHPLVTSTGVPTTAR